MKRAGKTWALNYDPDIDLVLFNVKLIFLLIVKLCATISFLEP